MRDNWQFELEEYVRQGEPEQAEKSEAWKAAIGLQEVDGLKTSAYLLETAREHIEGKINIDTAQKRIQSYYEERGNRQDIENDTKEADIVSARIAMMLAEKTFQFSPAEWISIHRRLFSGVLTHAGQIRSYNITKKEWVLKGETVYYASCDSIKETMEYDFDREKNFSYKNLTASEVIKHLAQFTAGIWQIHPFCEGNTRATAVFIIKYLKSFGFHVDNNQFSDYSWYFRNALVRANYNDLKKGIHETTEYLELFFENLLFGGAYELRNRYLHVDYNGEYGKKPVFDNTKPVFGDAKPVFDNSKPVFETVVISLSYKRGVKDKMLVLHKKFGTDKIFSRADIVEVFGISSNSAGDLIIKLKASGLIEQVSGYGKGKYRFVM